MNRTTLLTLLLFVLWLFNACAMARAGADISLNVLCTAVASLSLVLYAYTSGEQQVSMAREWRRRSESNKLGAYF
jgi:hypothetical protein